MLIDVRIFLLYYAEFFYSHKCFRIIKKGCSKQWTEKITHSVTVRLYVYFRVKCSVVVTNINVALRKLTQTVAEVSMFSEFTEYSLFPFCFCRRFCAWFCRIPSRFQYYSLEEFLKLICFGITFFDYLDTNYVNYS